MPKLPILSPGVTARVITDTFRGYNHNLKISDGEMYDTVNLSTDYYPMLAPRKPRGKIDDYNPTEPSGMIVKQGADGVPVLYVTVGTGLRAYKNGGSVTAPPLTLTATAEKQLVSFGAYVVIFPDKKYFNVLDADDYGSLDASVTSVNPVIVDPCDVDGNIITVPSSATVPVSPANGDYWYDTESHTLNQYSGANGQWTPVETVYTRYTFDTKGTIPELFKAGDGVEFTVGGVDLGSNYLYKVGGRAPGGSDTGADDYIVVIGFNTSHTAAGYSIKRSAPSMDFVIECQNRLWGCKYGKVNGQFVNELYCSALGDFKNWRQYQGLSTDSWAASVGSDGAWTGAINYQGRPCFFKEDRVHTISVSPTGGHRVDEFLITGVEKGSWRSLVAIGDTLYYKAKNGVYAWQGGIPALISAAFGDVRFIEAVGGAYNNKYYLSLKPAEPEIKRWWDEDDGEWKEESDGRLPRLYVYDTKKGLWIKEDNFHATAFAAAPYSGGKAPLYALNYSFTELWDMYGYYGDAEESVSWSMETGILYYEYPDKKYLSRYDVRLYMGPAATAKIYLEYDSNNKWIESGNVHIKGTGTVVVPIRPRRCDHLRMKLEGTGEVKVLSIARTLEVGSDV